MVDSYYIDDSSAKGLFAFRGNQATLTSVDPNCITAELMDRSNFSRAFSVNGDGIKLTFTMTPADQNMQYKFNW